MGELKVEKLLGNPKKPEYIRQLLTDIDALEHMLSEDMFVKTPIRIGAEQEFCLVDNTWAPSNKAQEVLKAINEEHFTSELTLYNLEINLDPLILEGNCFSKMHQQLDSLLAKAKEAAAQYKQKIVLTGILPTITTKHIDLSYMTPAIRYFALNDAIKEIRKLNIELHIKGVDEVNLHHDSILYEGCNTSFQSHLQIDPDDFVNTYNWAQAISGPILSVCTNSPLLMGRELWQETRIALFAQSVDTRPSSFRLTEREPRVGFGNDWVKGNVADFYKNSIVRFRSLLTKPFESDSMTELKKGNTPKLHALNLHNGTVYKWNRLCYGITDGKPHLRIENRYMPSGPTTQDEIANMMFWIGVMQGRPKAFDDIHTKMDFKDVKSNFFNAARYGMASQFFWDGKIVCREELLLKHFLPMAYKGLSRMNVSSVDAEKYLTIIQNRIKTRNGSRWMVKAYRKLKQNHKTPEALKILTAAMHERQEKAHAVDAWKLPTGNEFRVKKKRKKVKHIMNTKTITALESDSAELVLKMMQWNNIHHLPILDNNRDLVGLLTWNDVETYLKKPDKGHEHIQEIMKTELITATAETKIKEAKALMKSNKINCLPVIENKKLIGIITSNDF